MKKALFILLSLPLLWAGCDASDFGEEGMITDEVTFQAAPPAGLAIRSDSLLTGTICGTMRVTTTGLIKALIRLNRENIFKPNDFHGSGTQQLEKPVTLLEGANALSMAYLGKNGSTLKVEVFNCATPPNPLFYKYYVWQWGNRFWETAEFDSVWNPD